MITRLRVRHFKALQEADVPLRPLSLFTGLNGMGKSSLMQVLLLLRQSQEQRSVRQGLALNGPLVELGTGQDVLSEGATDDTISFDLWDDHHAAPFSWKFAAKSTADVLDLLDYATPPEIQWERDDAGRLPNKALPSTNFAFMRGDRTQYLCAERLAPQTAYPASSYAVQQRRLLGKHGEYTAHFLAVYGEEAVSFSNLLYSGAAADAAIPNTLLRQVGAWLGDISPGLRLEATEHPDFGLVRVGYRYQTSTGTTAAYRPANVGFGLSYALPILTAILSARPGSLLLIENPESHLHPRGQSRLGELLALAAQNKVQLLVETHSDHILNGVRVAVKKYRLDPASVGLYFFERAPLEAQGHQSVIVQPHLDADGRIDVWPRHFFDEWDHNLMELL